MPEAEVEKVRKINWALSARFVEGIAIHTCTVPECIFYREYCMVVLSFVSSCIDVSGTAEPGGLGGL